MTDTSAEELGTDETRTLDAVDGAGAAVDEADDIDDTDSDDVDSADADDEASDAPEGAPTDRATLLVQEGDIAADYLEQLLDIVDYDGDIDLDVENDRAVVSIEGDDLQALVGARGETLDALQELTRLAVAQQTGVRRA